MKIDGLGARPAMTARGPETGHRAASLDSDFASELEDQQGNMTREQLQQMLEEIYCADASFSPRKYFDKDDFK